MWHEARRQEKKVREVMVNLQRRAERRKEHYERLMGDPMQLLRITGTKAKIHLDPAVAAAGDSKTTMMPWSGNPEILISQYDVRVHLETIPDYSKLPKPQLSAAEYAEEMKCNYERYRNLVINLFQEVSEEDYLKRINIEEMYPKQSTGMDKEKVGGKAAIGYSYGDSVAEDYNLSDNDSDVESIHEEEAGDALPPKRPRKRKLVKESVAEPKRIINKPTAVTSDEATATTEIKKPKKKVSEKHTAKQATMIACNSTAKHLFNESDELRKLNQKIQELQTELKHQKELQHQRALSDNIEISSISTSGSSESDDEDMETYRNKISSYEAAAIRRRDENQMLLKRLLKDNETASSETGKSPLLPTKNGKYTTEQIKKPHTSTTERREKVEIPKVELVKGMGIMVKGSALASVLSKSKRQPTRLLRFLMAELFTEEELRCSTVRGKKGNLPGLDKDVMNAILLAQLNVNDLSATDVDKLNLCALEFKISAGYFGKMLHEEKSYQSQQQYARQMAAETRHLHGKHAKRERRLFRESKRFSHVQTTPPSYAQRDSPTYEPYESNERNQSRSRSSTPEMVQSKVEYITEFGAASDNDEGSSNKTATTQSSRNRSSVSSPRSSTHRRHTPPSRSHRRSRSRSRSRERHHRHHRSRSRDSERRRYRSRSSSTERYSHKSYSRSKTSYHRSHHSNSRSRTRSRSPVHHRSRYHRSRSSSSDSNSDTTPSPVNKRLAKVSTSEKKDSSTKKATGTKSKLTPQERLQKKLQLQLNKHLKQDKKTQKIKASIKAAEQMEREDDLREQARKWKSRDSEAYYRD